MITQMYEHFEKTIELMDINYFLKKKSNISPKSYGQIVQTHGKILSNNTFDK